MDVNNGVPVQVLFEKKTANITFPVGLKPPTNVAVSMADTGGSPKVIDLGLTDATISTLTLVTVIGTVAIDTLTPFVTAK